MPKTPSPKPSLDHERKSGFPDRIVIGVDEVGRGCLAGPVMAGAFAFTAAEDLHPPEWLSQVRDSKLLSSKTRTDLYSKLSSWTAHWAVASASVAEIDSLNILRAAELAMQRAVEQVIEGLRRSLGEKVDSQVHILVDGNRVPSYFRGKATAIVGGDRLCLSVACASVLAKVQRDELLVRLDQLHPGYGLAVHKGYGTPEHLKCLAKLRPSPEHRRSFAPVRQALESRGD
ncbi:MAG: ribonuclease HII [Bdellovibrionales bacterium]|nr:ribonuclease HII [Bdellovibrionales bacterium]